MILAEAPTAVVSMFLRRTDFTSFVLEKEQRTTAHDCDIILHSSTDAQSVMSAIPPVLQNTVIALPDFLSERDHAPRNRLDAISRAHVIGSEHRSFVLPERHSCAVGVVRLDGRVAVEPSQRRSAPCSSPTYVTTYS
jgi:hypothetical protein